MENFFELFAPSTLIGVAVLLGLGFWLRKLQKENPSNSLGETINHLLLNQKVTILVLSTIFINVAEAMFAASIHPPGEAAISAPARFTGHLVIAIVAITMALSAIATWSRVKKVNGPKAGTISMALTFTFAALALPAYNLMLIGSGLKELPLVLYFFQGNMLWSMERMSYAMNASTMLTVVHYTLIIVDGITLIQGKGLDAMVFSGLNADFKPINDKINEKGEKTKEGSPDSHIAYILKAYRLPFEKESRFIKDSIRKKDVLADKPKAKLATIVAKLYEEVKALQDDRKRTTNKEDAADINNKIYAKIKDVWAKSHVSGDGFGVDLPKKKSNSDSAENDDDDSET